MNFTLLAAACSLVTAFSAAAATPKPAPANVRVEVQIVAVPLAKAVELLPELRDPDSIDEAFTQIQEMLSSSEAKLIAWPELRTKSGQRAVTEDVEEMRYPSEYVEVSRSEHEPPPPKDASKRVDQDPMRPTAFATRNIGVTLEVEAVVLGDSATIDLQVAPQHVRFLGYESFDANPEAKGREAKLKQPRFYTTKTNTSLSLRSGQRVLLGSFVVPEPLDHIEFFILQAQLIPVEAPAAAEEHEGP
ncbi:MAG: hypothetical protein QOE70_4500 [Chthoniobacter sp.]|jgi:hypothetical protein|nr:hypothetical protein [Chthoniobacter sp.]